MPGERPRRGNGLDPQSRRRALVDAAAELMCRRGYRGTSLKDIANELGMSEPALYHYFRNKEEILVSIYMETLSVGLQTVRAIRDSEGPADAKLRRVLAEFTRLVALNKMFVVFFHEKDELSPDNWKMVTRGEREFVATIKDIVIGGVKEGVFKELPPSVVSFGILGMGAWVYRWYRPEGPLPLDKIVDVFCEMIIGGLRKG